MVIGQHRLGSARTSNEQAGRRTSLRRRRHHDHIPGYGITFMPNPPPTSGRGDANVVGLGQFQLLHQLASCIAPDALSVDAEKCRRLSDQSRHRQPRGSSELMMTRLSGYVQPRQRYEPRPETRPRPGSFVTRTPNQIARIVGYVFEDAGSRPLCSTSSLCGAALPCSSRLNGFDRVLGGLYQACRAIDNRHWPLPQSAHLSLASTVPHPDAAALDAIAVLQ